jgi:hypothetical protein
VYLQHSIWFSDGSIPNNGEKKYQNTKQNMLLGKKTKIFLKTTTFGTSKVKRNQKIVRNIHAYSENVLSLSTY